MESKQNVVIFTLKIHNSNSKIKISILIARNSMLVGTTVSKKCEKYVKNNCK